MREMELNFVSANRKTRINGVIWTPDERIPVAVLQISHGVTEHIGRYKQLAEFLTTNGFAVVAHDHLGHGKSIAEGDEPMYFGHTGSWEYVVADLAQMCNRSKKYFPGIPYYLLGFSMGSFAARQLLIEQPNLIDGGAILVGTGFTGNLEIFLGTYMANKEAKKVGEDKTSPVIRQLTFGTYNKPFEKEPGATDFEWLCANKSAIREYMNDELVGGTMTCGLFREMLYGMSFTRKFSNIQKMKKDLPVLFISGGDDPVGEKGRGVRKAYRAFKRAGIKDVRMKLYEGMRHDVLHEENCEDVYRRICRFIKTTKKRSY